ncbi:MAG: hypothetical protein VX884_03260 [Pseudomonadota bacterium]|nr:hypothetical protein [Pseudomonadota bacterium]
MGVLIIVGTSVIGVTIVRRAQDISENGRLVTANEVLNLHTGGSEKVKSIDVEDGVLFLHMETLTGDMIMGYDLSTGEVVNRIIIDKIQ